MTGEREQLAKAVVLACVSAAHQQQRACEVVAFSSANDVMECGRISCDAQGLQRLLDFLSNSFEGGTDVTGALKHAMSTLGTDAMAAADVLLLTDGELPNPPVSGSVLESLQRLRQRTGMEVHGLLVGKSESAPLEQLCSQTHNFLCNYDMLGGSQETGALPGLAGTSGALPLAPAPRASSSSVPSSLRRSPPLSVRQACAGASGALLPHPKGTARATVGGWGLLRGVQGWGKGLGRAGAATAMRAKASVYSDEGELISRRGGRGNKGRKQGRQQRYTREEEEDDDDEWIGDDDAAGALSEADDSESADDDEWAVSGGSGNGDGGGFSSRAASAGGALAAAVAEVVEQGAWDARGLDAEKDAAGSCWRFRDQLAVAVGKVSRGLVEREEEARLVVLGMVAQEHVLLLGPPGTGKSALGRRISELCGGAFFQRLLTRFTTPEEIFGPLSLRALENDEYRRCTEGFLPTAAIGFLDEIFKANSAILNTLLTILNERQFDNGAGEREECPIRCVIGASNELPESDELDALYDRFLIRKEVRHLLAHLNRTPNPEPRTPNPEPRTPHDPFLLRSARSRVIPLLHGSHRANVLLRC